jgi:hypothetical protein
MNSSLHPAVAAEEPGAVADDRPADGARRVERRELLIGGVLVVGHQARVLEEVVARPMVGVRARLRDHAREEARGADEFGGNAPREDLLLLDDLGVQVGTERPADRIGDVDAVEIVVVVARHPEVAADVGVVDARLGGGVARLLRIVGQDARHELQVALIRTPRRQRFGQLQRDVGPGRGARRIDDRRIDRHLHLLGDSTDGERDANRRGLAGAHEDVLVARGLEAWQLRGDHVA